MIGQSQIPGFIQDFSFTVGGEIYAKWCCVAPVWDDYACVRHVRDLNTEIFEGRDLVDIFPAVKMPMLNSNNSVSYEK